MSDIVTQLDEVIRERMTHDPEKSYVSSLFHSGLEKIQKKVGEEAIEAILASESGSSKNVVNEVADLWFHSMVLLAARDVSATEVLQELERRFGLSGIDEKNSRDVAAP